MAYTIISQNNSTTTLSDGVNTITVPSRVNLTSGNFTIVEVNNNMATLEDGDGNVYRDIPCVATLAGEGGGGGSGLPDQTGHSGEFLTTDGTDASWSDKPLVNTATGSNSLTILGTATSNSESINIGLASAVHDDYSVVYGNNARTSYSQQSVVVGFNAAANDTLGTQQYFNTVCGYAAQTRDASNGVAIGNQAFVGANGAMQFGCGGNTEAGTVCFALTTTNDDSNFTNYKLLDSDGTIPTDRLTKVNSTITLTAAGWSGGSQTVTVSGVTSSSIVWVSPDPTDQSAYVSAGILCTAQGTDSLTFTATTTPSADIDVVVVAM